MRTSGTWPARRWMSDAPLALAATDQLVERHAALGGDRPAYPKCRRPASRLCAKTWCRNRWAKTLRSSSVRRRRWPRAAGSGFVDADIDVFQPAVAVGDDAVDVVEERLLERRGDGTAPAAADWILSTDRIGVISAAVPQKNISSAM